MKKKGRGRGEEGEEKGRNKMIREMSPLLMC